MEKTETTKMLSKLALLCIIDEFVYSAENVFSQPTATTASTALISEDDWMRSMFAWVTTPEKSGFLRGELACNNLEYGDCQHV